MLLLQVGFIANLKSDKSHKVIQDVSGLPWSPLDFYTLLCCCNMATLLLRFAFPACYCHTGVIRVCKDYRPVCALTAGPHGAGLHGAQRCLLS